MGKRGCCCVAPWCPLWGLGERIPFTGQDLCGQSQRSCGSVPFARRVPALVSDACLPLGQVQRHSSALLQRDLALIFESTLVETVCFICQYLFIKTLFCLGLLKPEFSRVFGWVSESSSQLSFSASLSFVRSLEEDIPQASAQVCRVLSAGVYGSLQE